MAVARFEMCKKINLTKFGKAVDLNLVDKALISFLKKFNKKKNYYTSSSCTGRIMVLGLDEKEVKKPKLFVFKAHKKIKLKEIKEALKEEKYKELWLKQEPYIFHITAKSLETAEKLLKLKTDIGIRRGGIFFIKENKYLIELMGSQHMSLPIKIDNNILFNNKQLGILVKKANTKLDRNYKILKEVCKELLKL